MVKDDTTNLDNEKKAWKAKEAEQYRNISALKEKILKVCIDSGLTYWEVYQALKNANWYFLSRAEAFLKNAEISKVSASESTPYIELFPQIMDTRADKQNEDHQ